MVRWNAIIAEIQCVSVESDFETCIGRWAGVGRGEQAASAFVREEIAGFPGDVLGRFGVFLTVARGCLLVARGFLCGRSQRTCQQEQGKEQRHFRGKELVLRIRAAHGNGLLKGWPQLIRRIATLQAVKSDILRNSQAVASTAKGATGAKEKQRENLRIFLRFCFCFSPVAPFAVDAGFWSNATPTR